jgi:hypothetical protein
LSDGPFVAWRRFHERAQFLEAGVKEKADVCDAQLRHVGDFFVGEVVLKFQADDFPLILWELVEQAEQ